MISTSYLPCLDIVHRICLNFIHVRNVGSGVYVASFPGAQTFFTWYRFEASVYVVSNPRPTYMFPFFFSICGTKADVGRPEYKANVYVLLSVLWDNYHVIIVIANNSC